MSLLQRIEDASSGIIVAAVSTLVAAIGWLVRRVLTNQTQIELLQSEIRHRDEIRQADRETVQEVRSDVKELRKEIREIFNKER